jgi:hypothetical protein
MYSVRNICTLYKSLNKLLFGNICETIYDISYIDEEWYSVSSMNTTETLFHVLKQTFIYQEDSIVV